MRLRVILAGVDGSAESTAAATLAHQLALASGAVLRLHHAVPEFTVPSALQDVTSGGRMPPQHTRDQAQRAMRAALRGHLPDAVLDWLQVDSGKPAAVLAEVARRFHADLVVVGGKRRGPIARRLAGSVVTHLIRTLDVPLWLVREGKPLPRRVLVAADLSPASATVLREAFKLATLLGARARAVFVAEPTMFPGREEILARALGPVEVGREALERMVAQISPALECTTRRGEAAPALAEAAGEWDADLIVVGSHGKDWVDRLLIGSTTERLAAQLPTSLLVLPVAGLLAEGASDAGAAATAAGPGPAAV